MPRTKGFKHRNEHIIDRLKKRHRLHVIEWDTFSDTLKGLIGIAGSITYYYKYQNGVYYHHIVRFYDAVRRLSRDKSKASIFNEVIFQKQVRYIIKRFDIDIMVAGPSSYLTGFPPFNTDIPLIFDYLDCADWSVDNNWKKIDINYISRATAVIAASNIGLKQAKLYNKNVYYVPNGVDVYRFQGISGKRVRKKYGLADKKIVSLIGITCDPSLYFIDALGELNKERGDLRCLIVGDATVIPEIGRRVKQYKDTFILTGPVVYARIPEYFAATDIGLYPQYEGLYYHAMSPIKVFEYTASGKWIVVSPELDEVARLGFSNVIFSKPDLISLKKAIGSCLDREPPKVTQDIFDYDWQKLADKFENILHLIFKLSSL